MKTKRIIGCVIIAMLIIILLISTFFYFLLRPAPVFETNNIADYGVIKGNYDNERPREFVFSFFPEKIEEYFSDVSYHYKAKKGDTYAYEMYLEFMIQDTQTYSNFITDVIGDNASEPFYFDSSYQVYYVSNYLTLSPAITISRNNKSEPPVVKEDKSKPPVIDNAKIGAVLFSDAEQRIIFWALGAYDGGGTSTDELNYFFNRFGINPWAYEKRDTPGYAS